MIQWTQLNSGGFQKIGYDPMQKQLHVKCENEDYIIYYEVRETEYVGMFSSQDMKKYYEERIKGRFPSSTVKT
ncbi:MAG: KTSC domain-containing protein [Alkalicoccus sp.]|nr:MAG: KTSC domain-containing protein [Alkalicoccus sp.]